MHDILEEVDVRVHCDECGDDYDVPASVIRSSQELLAEGCPGSPYECPPSFFATLVASGPLRSLALAWREVERSASSHAAGLALRVRPELLVFLKRRSPESALARWEDDGGAACT